MKNLFLLTMLMFASVLSTDARIINGWEKDVINADTRIKLLDSAIALNSHNKNYVDVMKDEIGRLQTIKVFYEKTNEFLNQFKEISPVMYGRLYTLTDAKGRFVDVYVKLVSLYDLNVDAYSNLTASKTDPHQHISEFGENTVSIQIKDNMRKFYNLAHEFGHVTYQVENLESYLKYYKKAYHNHEGKEYGHKRDDPSGMLAKQFENWFHTDKKIYQKNN